MQPEIPQKTDRPILPDVHHGNGDGEWDGVGALEGACCCGHPIVTRNPQHAVEALRDHMAYCS